MIKKLSVWLLALCSSVACQAMTQGEMESIVKKLAIKANGGEGMLEFMIEDMTFYLLSDTEHDRMRIITPVAQYDRLSAEQLDAVLESNYHKALDARYAVSEGILFSVYIHPLSPLTEQQLVSAISQVMNLALTFGEDYSSGALNFNVKKDAESVKRI